MMHVYITVAANWPEALKRLSEPLPDAAIERTDGRRTGKGYDTVGYGYQWVVDRLNEVLGPQGWKAMVESIEYEQVGKMVECTVLVHIEAHVDGVPADRWCFGGHRAKTKADAAKGAFTNGIKKTAALLGVGAAAYRDTVDDDNTPIIDEPPTSRPQPPPKRFDAKPSPPDFLKAGPNAKIFNPNPSPSDYLKAIASGPNAKILLEEHAARFGTRPPGDLSPDEVRDLADSVRSALEEMRR